MHSTWRCFGCSKVGCFMCHVLGLLVQEKCYVHDIFITFSQQILSDRLLLVVMGGQKNNLSYEFKLESIITYHLWFVVKMLWT